RKMEVQFSLEQKLLTGSTGGVPVRFLTTETAKTTLGEAIDRTKAVINAPPPPGTVRGARVAGFTAGTAAGFLGDYAARSLGSDRIRNTAVRNAVNASAAATAGLATDYAVTRGVAKIAPAIGRVASKVGGAAAASKLAAPLARVASRVPWAS